MSRYALKTYDESTIFVGWDNPMQTFFFQKYINYDQENEELLINFGSEFQQIPTLANLEVFALNQDYRLDKKLIENLYDDFEQRTEPTLLQKNMNKIFTDLKIK
jgi:hypothetical protein